MSYHRKTVVRNRRTGKKSVVYQAMGDSSTPDCNSVVGSMSSGSSCTLPDGSNIANWNGSQLVNPAGGAIDSTNAAALVAGGWQAGQVSGAAGTAAAAAAGGSGFNWGTAGGVAGNLLSSIFGPKPATGVVVQPGMSPTTMLALAGAGVLAIVMLTKKRD